MLTAPGQDPCFDLGRQLKPRPLRHFCEVRCSNDSAQICNRVCACARSMLAGKR